MSDNDDTFLDESSRHGIEDPTYSSNDEIEEIHERLDTFEHYIDHIHDRLDYLEDQFDVEIQNTREEIIQELEETERAILENGTDQREILEERMLSELSDNIHTKDEEMLDMFEQLEGDQENLHDKLESLEENIYYLTSLVEESKTDMQTSTTENVLTSKELDRRLDLGLHIPLLAGGSMIAAVIGIALVLNGSIFSVPTLGLAIFLGLNSVKIAKKQDQRLTDVI